MPIYRYRCEYCGWEQEDLESIHAPSEKHDPHPCVCERQPSTCDRLLKRIPSLPAPAQFNCSMPTYQRKKT